MAKARQAAGPKAQSTRNKRHQARSFNLDPALLGRLAYPCGLNLKARSAKPSMSLHHSGQGLPSLFPGSSSHTPRQQACLDACGFSSLFIDMRRRRLSALRVYCCTLCFLIKAVSTRCYDFCCYYVHAHCCHHPRANTKKTRAG